MNKPLCIYLHGFGSSGNATKSQLLQRVLVDYDVDYLSPHLLTSPKQAIAQIQAMVTQRTDGDVFLVGSSLGGYYATVVANALPNTKVVLINPALTPWDGYEQYLGRHVHPHSGEEFIVTEQHVHELKEYALSGIHRQGRYLLLLQTDDDVVDHQIAKCMFPSSPSIVRTGGGHRFTDFEQVIPDIINFFGFMKQE